VTEHTLPLPDGRTLGYARFGDENAQAVLYFHGTPSSRLEPVIMDVFGKPLEALLQRYKLQLISIDRPGMGQSTFSKAHTIDSFASDVKILMQALHLQPCALLCWSGGGPYALAMAYHYPHLITRLFIVAGFSASFGDKEVFEKMSWNKMYFNTARKMPLALEASLALIKHQEIKTPIHQHLYDLSNVDYFFLKNVDQLNGFLQYTIKEACRDSADGPVQEAQLYFQPFAYSLRALETPVHFWWGTEDNMVIYEHAKRLEKDLPHVTPHYKPGEGHLSIYINYMEEVLHTIAAG